jgi:oxalate decarboxylase family bicupin protein
MLHCQWPLGLSHAKLGLNRAGWSRQQNVDNIPQATEMAGVDMRLEEGGYRELHWHKAAEWSYILSGSVRVQAMNDNGETFVDDLSAGDVWFFPPGIPHSLQGLEGGVEFLLVFDDGSFSEDNTFLASETFARNPVRAVGLFLTNNADIHGRKRSYPKISTSHYQLGIIFHQENCSSSPEPRHPKTYRSRTL